MGGSIRPWRRSWSIAPSVTGSPCIFVDNGVLRFNEVSQIQQRFVDKLQLQVVFEDASDLFLDRLSGVTDPERKRKVIGATFIEVFEASAAKLGQVDYLVQGDAVSRCHRERLGGRSVGGNQRATTMWVGFQRTFASS